MTLRRALLALLLVWEVGWAYAFFTAPVPDYRMQATGALIFGVILPLCIAAPFALVRIFK